jgi:hypothetical protein
MLTVPELNLGSIDAVNYKQRSQKEYLSRILYKDQFLDSIISEGKYFVIGEKGTGKTSFAAFLQNNSYKGCLSKIVSLNETDYRKFINLNQMGKFTVSDYTDIWKVILLLLVGDLIADKGRRNLANFQKFNTLQDAVQAYYKNAFRPEVDYTLEMVANSEDALKFVKAGIEAGFKDGSSEKTISSNFQMSLKALQLAFEDAISPLKLSDDLILFIDGIDIRPDQIEFGPYIECIRGLANATWQLNTEFFANIKDSKGRVKIALLMRPDILDNMGFQNLNAKVRDNGVVLNWETAYDQFRSSPIFSMVCGILAKQQDPVVERSEAWAHYFRYELESRHISEKVDDPFIGFLRYSFYRPRDIIQYLQLMQDYVVQAENDKALFSRESFFKAQREYSDYLLGEVKDYLSFYYSTVDFDYLVGFFAQLEGRSDFTWDYFSRAYHKYVASLSGRSVGISELTSTPEEFLQFLYSMNVIGYLEKTESLVFVHYCFRDRTPVKLRPRVKLGLEYTVHPGLQRALLVGGGTRRKR